MSTLHQASPPIVSRILRLTTTTAPPLTSFVGFAPPNFRNAKANFVFQSPLVLSHLHADHFDDLVAEHIRKSLPIVSTPHACEHLKAHGHTALYPLKTWEEMHILKGDDQINIVSMPGKHTLGVMDAMNAHLHLIPPVMGSMVTFKKAHADGHVQDYNLYISGDTLYYDELKVSFARSPSSHCGN